MTDKKKIYILVTAVLLGFFAVVQSRSYGNVDFLLRDAESNIFQEIRILKQKNEDLKSEISELELTLSQLADQNLALQAIEDEIKKYRKLSGGLSIFGPGLTVTIDGTITTPWMIDLVNDFFSSGAQAVAVNGIRLVNPTIGFDTLPQGQILLNGSILSPPYVFDVIGESSSLKNILELPGGVFDRLKSAFPGIKIETVSKDIIQMG